MPLHSRQYRIRNCMGRAITTTIETEINQKNWTRLLVCAICARFSASNKESHPSPFDVAAFPVHALSFATLSTSLLFVRLNVRGWFDFGVGHSARAPMLKHRNNGINRIHLWLVECRAFKVRPLHWPESHPPLNCFLIIARKRGWSAPARDSQEWVN